MKPLGAVAVAVVTATALPVAPASAATPPGPGRVCAWTLVGNPSDDSSRRWSGHVDAGPIVIADGTAPRAGRVTCTFTTGWTHDGPAVARVSSLTTPGVVALPPTPVEFDANEWDVVRACTSVEVLGGATYYWDDPAQEWTLDPDVTCYDWSSPPPPPPDPVGLANDLVLIPYVDPVLCPALVDRAPGAEPVTVGPDGDVYVNGEFFWDCPPYEGT